MRPGEGGLIRAPAAFPGGWRLLRGERSSVTPAIFPSKNMGVKFSFWVGFGLGLKKKKKKKERKRKEKKLSKHRESRWVLGNKPRAGSCPVRNAGRGTCGVFLSRSAAGPGRGSPQHSPALRPLSQAPGTGKVQARLGNPGSPPWAAEVKIYGVVKQMRREPDSVLEPFSSGSWLQCVTPLF